MGIGSTKVSTPKNAVVSVDELGKGILLISQEDVKTKAIIELYRKQALVAYKNGDFLKTRMYLRLEKNAKNKRAQMLGLQENLVVMRGAIEMASNMGEIVKGMKTALATLQEIAKNQKTEDVEDVLSKFRDLQEEMGTVTDLISDEGNFLQNIDDQEIEEDYKALEEATRTLTISELKVPTTNPHQDDEYDHDSVASSDRQKDLA